MSNTETTTTLRPHAAYKRPYGTPCYRATVLDYTRKQVVWEGDDHDTEEAALEQAGKHIKSLS